MSADKSKPLPKKPAPPKAKQALKPVPVKTADDIRPPAKTVVPTAADAPKPSKDTIYVDNDDEITAIIDKVESAKSGLVALVLPKRAQVLQSIVNMRLLKRSADQADKNLVLVTNEAAVLPLAGAAGVNVAKNLQSKPYMPASPIPVKGQAPVLDADGELDEKDATLDHHRSMGELAVNEETDGPETIKLGEDAAVAAVGAKMAGDAKKAAKPPKDKRLRVPNFDKFRLSMVALVGGLVLLIILFIVAGKVLPKATIDIQTTGTPVNANFNLTSSDSAKALDLAKAIIPASLKTADQTSSQQVKATGTQNNGAKAAGSVTMTSCIAGFSAPDPVSGGSTIRTASGLTFVTQEKTEFKNSGTPSGTCISYEAKNATTIVATTGGANYNVASGTTFTVNGRSDVSATGSASGGTDNNVTVLTQADVDKAKAGITSQTSDAFSKDFQKKLEDQGLYLIAPSLKIAEPAITATPNVGQPASTATVNIKITYSVLTVKKDDLKAAVSDQLKKKIDPSKQQILDSDVLKSVVITLQNQTSPTAATLNITAQASASPNIDTEAIKKQAAGKKKGQIRDFIAEITGVKGVEVKMSPFWVTAVPASKIKVNLNLDKEEPVAQPKTENAQP